MAFFSLFFRSLLGFYPPCSPISCSEPTVTGATLRRLVTANRTCPLTIVRPHNKKSRPKKKTRPTDQHGHSRLFSLCILFTLSFFYVFILRATSIYRFPSVCAQSRLFFCVDFPFLSRDRHDPNKSKRNLGRAFMPPVGTTCSGQCCNGIPLPSIRVPIPRKMVTDFILIWTFNRNPLGLFSFVTLALSVGHSSLYCH
ncbi:hypothetical protein BC828DRAFT_273436 [Blastocladiella britannica]|nr:hypothetical protein BC828DRAFT_273436 [Blastocladiella britannica]